MLGYFGWLLGASCVLMVSVVSGRWHEELEWLQVGRTGVFIDALLILLASCVWG